MAQAQAEAAREAREAAREAREVAREAREVAKEERELFADRAGKVKDVLHPPTLVMAILYPVVIGFTLQARWWHFSLAPPRPLDEDKFGHGDGDGPNQWKTFNAVVFQRTLYSFFAYTFVHCYLLAQMRIVGPGAPKHKLPYSLAAPIFFAWIGITYFYTYVSLSRYGAHKADWAAMAGFSIVLVMMTSTILWAPVSTTDMIDGLPEFPRPPCWG